MNDLIRVVPDNPVDEEFSVKECAVQKRTDSKKSNDDETSYTSGISDSTSEDFTSGLSQEIRPAKTAKLNNNNNNNNNTTTITTTTNSITFVTPSNNNTTATFTSTNNTVDLNNAVNSQQQQQQYLQQQQNLQQLLQAQKIQTPNYMSTNSTTTPTLTTLISNTSVNQSNNNSASLDQASKQTTLTTTGGGGGLSTLKSVQSMDTTIMEELLLKQSQSYYIQNTNSASNARVSLTQAPILMQLSRQTSQTQPNSSQHSLSRQNSTQQQQQQQQQPPQQQQQQPVATKQLQPQPTQKNLNSHYLSSGVASTNSIISTNDLKVSTTSQQNTPKPAIQQQQQQQQQQSTAMDTVLKNKPSYSLQLNEATNYSKPIIVSTSQPPPQQHQPQTQPIHPPSQSVPPILPNQSQQLQQQQQQQSKPNEIHLNQQTSSMYDRSSAIKKAILNDKAKSFSEYKAYLDYLKNGTGTGLGVNTIKTFESQLEASKALNTNQFPNLTIVRPYNPNEANLIRSNNTANTTPNSNIINTNNINNNNNNNNYNNNFLNTMSMLSINSNTNNTNNNNNNNNIMVQALMKPIQYFPQQSQQTFSGVSQHHSQQIQPNRIKFNPQQQAFTNIKSSPLIQPSYSSFSFNPNQSYMNNSNSNPNTTNNNNNNNRISYFPTMSQRVINKTYHPVQSNNVHPSYYHGHGF